MKTIRQQLQASLGRGLFGLPEGLLRVAAGPPVVKDGQTLDVQCQVLVRLMHLRGETLGGGAVAAARRRMSQESGTLGPRATGRVIAAPLGVAGAGQRLAARHYRLPGGARTRPAIVYFHGGGFVLGDLDSHDGVCRALARYADCDVIAIDYRLAPEHPAPAAAQDAVAAFRDLAARADTLGLAAGRLAVAGDSAGGNLAAIVAQHTRGDVHAPCYQALFYPVVDFSRERESRSLFARGFVLEKSSMDWFEALYIPASLDRRNPWLSPIHGTLAGTAPALVQTAGFDPLRDEGEAYAAALTAAGVRVTGERESGLIHGYLNLAGGVARAGDALRRAAAHIREVLHA